MGKAKKTTAAKPLKEPVRIRFKKLADGTQSIYLDIYHKGQRSYQFLKLYLLPEKTATIKRQNEATLTAANAIKSQMIIKLANNDAGLMNTSANSKLLLLDWMQTYFDSCERRGRKGNHLIESTVHALKGFRPKVKMGEIDRQYCLDLKDWLCNTYRKKDGKRLADYSIINYMGVLRGALNEAVRAGIIPENPMNRLTASEKVKAPESQREFLTIEEIKLLIDTPCPNELAKKAFLFSCHCGLRLSDIRKLRWKDIQKDGEQWRANIVMHKTHTPIYLPLAKSAMAWLPERGSAGDDDKVFEGLCVDDYLNVVIRKWAKAAGIVKHISYHVSRHSYATMLLTLGSDLYTVSKLLGHSNIQTTQIYGKIVNRKKEEAIGLLDSAYE